MEVYGAEAIRHWVASVLWSNAHRVVLAHERGQSGSDQRQYHGIRSIRDSVQQISYYTSPDYIVHGQFEDTIQRQALGLVAEPAVETDETGSVAAATGLAPRVGRHLGARGIWRRLGLDDRVATRRGNVLCDWGVRVVAVGRRDGGVGRHGVGPLQH